MVLIALLSISLKVIIDLSDWVSFDFDQSSSSRVKRKSGENPRGKKRSRRGKKKRKEERKNI